MALVLVILRRKRYNVDNYFFIFFNGVRYLLCMSDTSFEARFVGHMRFVLHFKGKLYCKHVIYIYIMFTIQYNILLYR